MHQEDHSKEKKYLNIPKVNGIKTTHIFKVQLVFFENTIEVNVGLN